MAFAGGQLAVFQSASEAPISEFIRVDPPGRKKNSQLATARRVVMQNGRAAALLVDYVSIQICSLLASGSCRTDGPF